MAAPIGGRYRLVSEIARGGMGSVWEGWDEILQRPVAVKMLHPQPGLSPDEAARVTSRALREARITARLHHPNAVPVYDVVDEGGGQPCLIMQFLPSVSLQELLRDKGPLPPPDVARVGADIAAALAAAHQAGIVHRDVKPGNVLIAEDGTAKLTDFGIAHAFGDATLTSTGMLTGTPAYLAPEVARGQPSSYASDVFSLGATLYAALEGVPPFGSDDNPMALLHRVASGHITPPQHRGPLVPVVMKMLAADPAMRPPARDVAPELARTLHAMSRSDSTTLLQPRRPVYEPTATMPPAAPPRRIPDADYRERPVAPAAAARAPSRGAPPPVRPPIVSRPAQRPEPRRRFPWVPVLAVGLLVALAAILLAVLLQNQGGGAGPGTSTTSSAPRASSSSHTRASASSPARSSAPSSSSSAPPSSTATSNPSSTASSQSGATPSASRLAHAITSYYSLLPRNTDAAWQRLTPSYQSGHAGGRASYNSFWGQLRNVKVSNVSGSPPGSAEATVTYYYRDGRVVIEDTEFGLVRQEGILKIDSTSVLSSRRG